MQNNPIGVFDSGVGGTSIWKEIHKLLPLENTIYLADSANAPYGKKSPEDILRLSIKNTELLLQHNCKIIVVACNTATTNAITYLRETYTNVSFIGIEPAIKPAVLQSNSKTVGVLATKGTLSSSLFHSTVKNHAEGIKIIEKEGEGLVPLIESGKATSVEAKDLLKTFLEPMLEQNIDYLVLGCTHYPYLIPVLKELLPVHVNIIDSGEAVARQTKAILERENLLNRGNVASSHKFYTNADVSILRSFLKGAKATVNVAYLDF
ncbi:glutamate racemase [Cellulophaga lytica]|uniref:glutamate racemase n=1 Tax=Cellulophaga lytica TaxID=979 RepID=UPI0026E19D97|nr:glutamate racemase [Cellulophaga lytica]MDO6852573.1 glutamate racemase [Cellulophaga lytica]